MNEAEKAELLFSEIDRLAREYDNYEFGLPQTGAVYDAIIELIAAALREKSCAR
jgi:hypothetical protein